MIPADKIHLTDDALLKALEVNNTQFGLSATALRFLCRTFGAGVLAEADVVARLEYLTGKGLASEVPKTLHREMRNWKVTDDGRKYLDEQNL